MNATQGKALLTATTNFLAMFDPQGELPELAELRGAIEMVSVAAPRKMKCVLCDSAVHGDGVSGFLGRKLKSGLAHETCAREYRQTAAEFKAWCQTPKIVVEFDAEKMALCACGHLADRHEHDELDNLLICLECDTCDHFHYDNSGAQKEAA